MKIFTRVIKRLIQTAVPASLAMLMVSGSSANETTNLTPKDVLGENRILVICGGAPIPSAQNWSGFAERDLIVFERDEADSFYLIRILDGKPIRSLVSSSKRFDNIVSCADSADYILIGKDTGVKKRWTDALPINDLFQTIDAMPMRQFEMRQRNRN